MPLWFNDYLSRLTIMTVHEASIHIKRTKPRRRIACSGVYSCAETAEKPDSKRFSGIEKVHRNSIKNTVDLWRTGWDSNPRAACATTWFRVRAVMTTSIPVRIFNGYDILANVPGFVKRICNLRWILFARLRYDTCGAAVMCCDEMTPPVFASGVLCCEF